MTGSIEELAGTIMKSSVADGIIVMTSKASAFILAFSVLSSSPYVSAAAQDVASEIVGVWRITEHVRKDVASGALEKPFGDRPQGRLFYTKGGQSIWFEVGDQPKLPGPAPTTDAERAELFKVMIAFTGTYRMEGSTMVSDTEVASVPGFRSQGATAEITGKTLVITSRPFISAMTGKETVVITTAERLE